MRSADEEGIKGLENKVSFLGHCDVPALILPVYVNARNQSPAMLCTIAR